MKVLVTGRDGQLARSLAERVAGHADYEFIFAARPELDLSDPAGAARFIEQARPDVVINAAAYTQVDNAEDQPELAFLVNAEAAGAMAKAVDAAGGRFIQISTDFVYDGRAQGAYREDAPTGPLNVYGRSKLSGEEAVRAAAPDAVVLRTSWVYSPYGRNFLRTMMALAETRDVVTVVADQLGTPSSALDVADGIRALLDRWSAKPETGKGRTYHLAGTGSTSWAGFAEQVMADCRSLGLPHADVRPIATHEYPTRAVRPRSTWLDTSAFARDFGYAAPDWRTSTAVVVRRLAG